VAIGRAQKAAPLRGKPAGLKGRRYEGNDQGKDAGLPFLRQGKKYPALR
jgi:hypothetical protein